MIDKIYYPIMNQLRTITEFKTFDLWNNQIQNESKELGFLRPACFLEIAEINPVQYIDNKQRIDGTATVRIVYESYTDFESDVLKENDGISLLINKVQRTLAKGFTGSDTATFERKAMRMPQSSNNIFIFEIDYSYSITDFIGSIEEDLIDIELSTLTFTGSVDIITDL